MPSLGRRAVGIILILSVVCIWVAAAVLIQVIFKDLSYNKPYFLTWFDSSWFVLYLVVFVRWRKSPASDAAESYWKLSDDDGEGEGDVERPLADAHSQASNPSPRPKPSFHDIVRVAAVISPLWFIANYFDNAALALTSVASNTILSSCSGLFTVAVATVAGQERFNIVKLFAAMCCLGGVACIALTDSKGSFTGDTIFGDILALLSAFIYAVYSVMLKMRLGEESSALVSAKFFAFVGLFNMLLFWPGMICLHYAGIEAWDYPSRNVFLALLLNALVGSTLADLLWARSLLLTSPLIATLGLSLMIPLSMLADVAIRGARFSPLYLLGSLLVLAGFVACNAEDAGGALSKRLRELARRCLPPPLRPTSPHLR